MALPLCASTIQNNCRTIFTREVVLTPDLATGEITVKSIVRWNTRRLQKVELSTTLTNWKAKF